MFSQEEKQAFAVLDRLIMVAKTNETLADLIDQSLNVARVIEPCGENQDAGPFQRMANKLEQLSRQMNKIEYDMINQTMDFNIATASEFDLSTITVGDITFYNNTDTGLIETDLVDTDTITISLTGNK